MQRSNTMRPDDPDVSDAHQRWAREAFHSLCGAHGSMPASGIKRRPFGKWLRAFIADMVLTGQLPLSSVVRTARIIDILFAKAEGNSDGCFKGSEFHSFTRVMSELSRDVDAEAEIAWSLFDLDESGTISLEDAAQLQALWTKLGHEVGEDTSFTTAEEYHSWFSIASLMRSSRTPPRACTAPSTSGENSRLESLSRNLGPARMTFTSQMRPQDQLLRSAEASGLSLQEGTSSSSGQTVGVRPMTPSRPSKPKRPRAKPAISVEAQAQGQGCRPRLPKVRKPLDWTAQSEWWTRKDNRLRPFMEVNATYLRPDGSQVQGVGILLNGWGVANKAAIIPHASAPEGARLGDFRKWQSDSPVQPSASFKSEAALATNPPETWTEEVQKWKDTDNNVVVLMHGSERLVKRECVRPVLTPRSHAQHNIAK